MMKKVFVFLLATTTMAGFAATEVKANPFAPTASTLAHANTPQDAKPWQDTIGNRGGSLQPTAKKSGTTTPSLADQLAAQKKAADAQAAELQRQQAELQQKQLEAQAQRANALESQLLDVDAQNKANADRAAELAGQKRILDMKTSKQGIALQKKDAAIQQKRDEINRLKAEQAAALAAGQKSKADALAAQQAEAEDNLAKTKADMQAQFDAKEAEMNNKLADLEQQQKAALAAQDTAKAAEISDLKAKQLADMKQLQDDQTAALQKQTAENDAKMVELSNSFKEALAANDREAARKIQAEQAKAQQEQDTLKAQLTETQAKANDAAQKAAAELAAKNKLLVQTRLKLGGMGALSDVRAQKNAALLKSGAEKDAQIASLKSDNATLTQSGTEKDTQIAQLTQEKSAQAATIVQLQADKAALVQAVSEFTEKMKGLMEPTSIVPVVPAADASASLAAPQDTSALQRADTEPAFVRQDTDVAVLTPAAADDSALVKKPIASVTKDWGGVKITKNSAPGKWDAILGKPATSTIESSAPISVR